MARHSLSLSTELEKSIDDWRAHKRPIPDLTQAIDALLHLGLQREFEKGGWKMMKAKE